MHAKWTAVQTTELAHVKVKLKPQFLPTQCLRNVHASITINRNATGANTAKTTNLN